MICHTFEKARPHVPQRTGTWLIHYKMLLLEPCGVVRLGVDSAMRRGMGLLQPHGAPGSPRILASLLLASILISLATASKMSVSGSIVSAEGHAHARGVSEADVPPSCDPGCPARGNCNVEDGRCECALGFTGTLVHVQWHGKDLILCWR